MDKAEKKIRRNSVKKVQISVYLPAPVVDDIRKEAEALGISASEFTEDILSKYGMTFPVLPLSPRIDFEFKKRLCLSISKDLRDRLIQKYGNKKMPRLILASLERSRNIYYRSLIQKDDVLLE